MSLMPCLWYLASCLLSFRRMTERLATIGCLRRNFRLSAHAASAKTIQLDHNCDTISLSAAYCPRDFDAAEQSVEVEIDFDLLLRHFEAVQARHAQVLHMQLSLIYSLRSFDN